MFDPIIGSFDSMVHAQQVHEALLRSGLPASAIEYRALEDEAGPVEGNFVSGNGKARGHFVDSIDKSVSYAGNFDRPVFRGTVLLIVRPQDEGQRELARSLLDASAVG